MKIFGITEDTYGVKRHYAVHVKSGQSVSFSRSIMITGINRHSKKTYARWELEIRIGFRRTNKGTLVAFTRFGKTFRDPTPAFNMLESRTQNPYGWQETPQTQAERLFVENVIGQFDIKSHKDIYPISEIKQLQNFGFIPQSLRTESRALDIMDFTRRTFGVRNYRKDLVRAVAYANMPTIAVAKEFKNLVPTDWLVRFLNDSTAQSNTYANIAGLREILLLIDPRSYRRLLRHDFNQHALMDLENVTAQYRGHKKRISLGARGTINIPNESFGSFNELHDRLIGYRGQGIYQDIPYENEVIHLNKVAGRLHGTKFGEYIISTAMETDDMISWGNYMQNCIGGYSQVALTGTRTYGAVYKKDEMIANFEIDSGGKLSQLLGRFNKNLDDDVRTIIESVLGSNGVNIPEHYWGRPQPVTAFAQDWPEDEWGILNDETDEYEPMPPADPFAAVTFEELLNGLDVFEPPRTRIQLGRGVYLANGVDENGNEVPL